VSWRLRSLFLRAQNAVEENQFDVADRVYSDILDADGNAMEALLHRAHLRLRMQKLNEALADIERFTQARPESGVGHMLMGEILIEKKDLIRAHQSLQTACRLEKDNGRAYYQLGRVCMELGRKHEAADYFEQALFFERDYAMAQWMAGGST